MAQLTCWGQARVQCALPCLPTAPDATAAEQSVCVCRGAVGALALGHGQGCYGGCFQPSSSFEGRLAEVHTWDRILTQARPALPCPALLEGRAVQLVRGAADGQQGQRRQLHECSAAHAAQGWQGGLAPLLRAF